MKLLFLGTGSAFAVDGNFQSNMLLQAKSGRNFLIDCGTDIRLSLFEQGFSYRHVHAVYLSHLHADHVGGLEWLAFTTKFDPECQRTTLYAPEGVLKDLWNKTLEGGLSSIQGITADIGTYFDVVSIEPNGSFTWEEATFYIVQTLHAISRYAIMPSFGLLIHYKEKVIFITTDSQFTPTSFNMIYQKADLIFHDCETSSIKSGVHAHFDELNELDESIKKKMWLYHYNAGPLPDPIANGFAGFVTKGQAFDLETCAPCTTAVEEAKK